MNNNLNVTLEGQLTQRVEELIPDLTASERLEFVLAMQPDDLRAVLAVIITLQPADFDSALVANTALLDRLVAGLK